MRALCGAIITAGALIAMGLVSIGFGTRYQLTKETTDASGQPVVMHLAQMDRPMVFILVFLTVAAIIGIGISFLGLAYHHQRRHHEFLRHSSTTNSDQRVAV